MADRKFPHEVPLEVLGYVAGLVAGEGTEELARREGIWRVIKALNRPGPADGNRLDE
jgi:hypothetical protein